MNKKYNHKKQEQKIYKLWEENKAFSPESVENIKKEAGLETKDKTHTILIPPPNANAPLHCGHALFAGIQDLMTRFKRMQGYKSLYLPGTDHAGFETQYVYEKKLEEKGKSRFDFDRKTFYKDVLDFVKENSNVATNQLKRLGISADWSRNTFMLDDKVVSTVYDTFEKMYKDGLVYREGYMVNYSTFHGTTFSDLETEYKEKTSPLYYIKYKLADSKKYITVATVRPETIYADTAIAVNPEDERFKKLIGKRAINPLNNKELPIIKDDYVDMEFGTGALKITPGHDPNDFKIGKKHDLDIITVIDLDGRMQNTEDGINGLYPKQARKKVAKMLKEKGSIEKIDEEYKNRVLVDYKDGKEIEPLVMPNWFIKTEDLFEKVIKAVNNEDVKFNKPLWKKEIKRWLKEKRPWPISRQIVFGIRIPAWYNTKENPDLQISFIPTKRHSELLSAGEDDSESPSTQVVSGKISELLKEYSLKEIKEGLQQVIASSNAKFFISKESPGEDFIQETDTFDTWFSSGQWPQTTLDYPNGEDFKEYYPTQLLESGWEIFFFWIARMIMFGLYLTNEVPFKNVYLHGMVTDKKGKKMSKSKGNVINPLDVVEEYGADPLRMALLVGNNTSARYYPLDMDKVRGYRNFANKIWNIGRFLELKINNSKLKIGDLNHSLEREALNKEDTEILEKVGNLAVQITNYLEEYKFKYAGEALYEFVWDDFANDYLEKTKDREDKEDKEVVLSVLLSVYSAVLKLLHPYMPFVTEAIWQEMKLGELDIKGNHKYLILSQWPKETDRLIN